MLNLKPSIFNFIFKREGNVAVYNSISMKTLYLNQITYDLFNRLSSVDIPGFVKAQKGDKREKIISFLKQLYEHGFFINSDANEQKSRDKIIENQSKAKSDLRIMYLFPTDSCNLACKYCFVEGDFQRAHAKMDSRTLRKSIDFFVQNSNKEKVKVIVIYGGEPLLEKQKVREIIDYSENKSKVAISLVTNGFLVDRDIAQYLSEKNVAVSVSLDGPKEINDSARITETKKGTFEGARKGYLLLKEYGCNLGISCTIGSHNTPGLVKNIEQLVDDLEPRVIGLNLLVDWISQKNPMYVPIDEAVDEMIETFEYLRDQGIHEERMMRRVKAFVEEKAYVRECGATGRQIVVFPKGEVGICHAFINNKDFMFGDIHDPNLDIEKIPNFDKWKTRFPFGTKECYDCSSISICGGGCPYEAYVSTGNAFAQDERGCKANLKILEWMIWDAFKNGKNKI